MLYLAPDDPDLKSFLGKSGKREKERARGREKRYRRQEPVSPYFRFSSFRERSERLGDALSRLISISFVNGMFFFRELPLAC